MDPIDLDSLFEPWNQALGKDRTAYRNHVERVLRLCTTLAGGELPDPVAFRVAAVYHDLDRADWIDVSLGLRNFGLPRRHYRELLREFPDAGFHRRLLELGGKRALTRPWSPLPMFRW